MKMVENAKDVVIGLPRAWKRVILMSFDFLSLSIVLWASFSLRLDRWVFPQNLEMFLLILSGPVIAIPIFIRMGLYRAVVRYLPERALWTMLQAVTLAVVVWVGAAFILQFTGRNIVPRSVPIIYWALASVCVLGCRFLAKRIFHTVGSARRRALHAVAIYGAGEAGTQLALSLRKTHSIIAFLDDNPNLHRREVAGVRVYAPSHLDRLIRDYGVKQVVLSLPTVSNLRRKEIIEQLSYKGVSVLSVPQMTDLVTGTYLVSHIREIEIDDLLGRSPVPPNQDLIRDMIVGRTIMVTGAGGSIGSELCRKISQWRPQKLVLFEANEFALYRIERELADKDLTLVPVLGSVGDAPLVKRTIAEHGVNVVFHAAAHKHVPLVEANALEGIQNNVLGTKTVVDAAFDGGVEDFVLISTDKAVRPTNVMGATKRWAELIVQQKAEQIAREKRSQHFCAVRFGNVLGSNGSVVPLFKEQIARGGPITLTDPGMTRYFMSIKEAAELIVQAGALSEGGDVFLLDMGEPVLVADLAENMVRLAGLKIRSDENPDGDIEIVVTGKRPGEKMYEELFYDAASASRTSHAKIMRSTNSTLEDLDSSLEKLLNALAEADEPRARQILFDVVAKSDRLQTR
jgi:FlaA1/EpsC-like NDP-sugar epimerase